MAGYIRQDTTNNIADGNVINASDFDNEYNAIEAAFHATTGHTHDGTSAEGAPITKIGPTQDVVASASALTPKTDNTVDLGSATLEYKDLYIDGTANIDSLVADTADINAGTIDGVTIGGASAGAGTFTTVAATTGNITTVNATTVDTTNLEVTNIKAKDGTASMTLADATGVATFSANPILNAGTANGVLYLNGSKAATSGSALVFDGSTVGVFNGATVSYRFNANRGTDDTTQGLRFGYAGIDSYRTSATLSTNQTPIAFTQTGSNGTRTAYNIDVDGNSIWSPGPGAGTEAMRLTSTGLGIGTSSPGYKVGVQSSSDAKISIKTTGVSSSAGLEIAGANATFDTDNVIVWQGGTKEFYLWNRANSYITFGTNNGEKARLDSSGNLGLGVTPSGWGNNFRAFQQNISFIAAYAADDGVFVGTNAYNDNTNWRYITTDSSSRYEQQSGAHKWYTAPSGTAGNAISFTQAMTLDASGNLGIGVTSPNFLLDVAGDTEQQAEFARTGTTTGASYARFVNSGGSMYIGVDSSVGGRITNATTPYAAAITTSNATPLIFGTNNTERARITSGGDLLVGGQTAATTIGGRGSKINAQQAAATAEWAGSFIHPATTGTNAFGVGIRYSASSPNSSGNPFLYIEDSTAVRARIDSNGGFANYQANDANLSDRREKTNFAPAKSYLDTICAIPVQTFNYVDQNLEDDPGLTLGVVAQDLQAVAPELVMESNWGTEDNPKMRLSIYQTDLQYALMKCIQELKAQNDELRARVAALEAQP